MKDQREIIIPDLDYQAEVRINGKHVNPVPYIK